MRRIFSFVLLVIFLAACNGQAIPPTISPTATSKADLSATLTPFFPVSTDSSLLPSATPNQAPLTTSTVEIKPVKVSADTLTITIVYNNIPDDESMITDWGFSALVEYGDQVVLFDTGTSGPILLQNMQALAIDPVRVEAVALSHPHIDHTGGLEDFLAVSASPPVYLLSSFGNSFIRKIQQYTNVIEATPGQVIAENILTTGEVSGAITEQALIIRTKLGMVIITGCAHPGIVRIIDRAIELTGEPVYMVLGGFHLGEKSTAEIAAIIEDFRRLGVQKVAPSHCTGDLAINMFAAEYGEDFIRTGAGSVIVVEK